ncbi:MAG: flagellar hook-associated protein FlgL [Alphaproteobacteria bacterium]
MRITQNMLNRNLTYSMNHNFERLKELNEQLSSGYRVNTASDDIVATGSILQLQRANNEYDVYMQNLNSVDSMLNVAASALQNVSEIMASVKEVSVQAATETYSDSDRQAMAVSLDGKLETVVTVLSATNENGYVFSGEAMRTKPFEIARDLDGRISAVTYAGEMIGTQVQVGPTTTAESNLVGQQVVNRTGNLFQTISDLREAVRAGDPDEIERCIGELDARHTDVLQSLGRLGERMSQYDVLRSTTETFRGLNTEIISDQRDANIGELSMEYNSQIALLEMVMKVTSRSLMPSLVNYV